MNQKNETLIASILINDESCSVMQRDLADFSLKIGAIKKNAVDSDFFYQKKLIRFIDLKNEIINFINFSKNNRYYVFGINNGVHEFLSSTTVVQESISAIENKENNTYIWYVMPLFANSEIAYVFAITREQLFHYYLLAYALNIACLAVVPAWWALWTAYYYEQKDKNHLFLHFAHSEQMLHEWAERTVDKKMCALHMNASEVAIHNGLFLIGKEVYENS